MKPVLGSSASSLMSASSSGSTGGGQASAGQHTIAATLTAVHKMDSELRCPSCRRFFQCPLLLPCGHSLCNLCAAGALLPASEPSIAASIAAALQLTTAETFSPASGPPQSSSSSSSTTGSSIGCPSTSNSQGNTQTMGCTSIIPSDSDQMSVVSETDSGVIVSSRPGSYVGRLPVVICSSTSGLGPSQTYSISSSSISLVSSGLICPICNHVVGLFDDKGLSHLPRNRALERIISKFVGPDQSPHSLKVSADLEPFLLNNNTDPINRPGGPLCQLCEEPNIPTENPSSSESNKTETTEQNCLATFWCEQCEIFYCTRCREKCHPARGPLNRHALHSATEGVEIIRQKQRNQPTPCMSHLNIIPNLYCVNCHIPVCNECISNDNSQTFETHSKHEILPLIGVCKSRKTELSQSLQALSERARSATEHIQRLRSKSETVNRNLADSEKELVEQLNTLITAIETKKQELTERLRDERTKRIHCLKEQINRVTSLLTKSTGLIQFCIEMLKESDPSAFLLVSQSLITRTQNAEQNFIQELQHTSFTNDITGSLLSLALSSSKDYSHHSPKKRTLKSTEEISGKYNNAAGNAGGTSTSNRLNKTLDLLGVNSVDAILRAILNLGLEEDQNTKRSEYFQLINQKINDAPAPPAFLIEECISERNVITLVWQPTSSIPIDRYTLELDDGAGGTFRKVYRGVETMCTVEGLHFRSVYRARVKAHNQAGESQYSERICLQTSDFTWFHLDIHTSVPEILLTNGNRTVTSQLSEDRVILGSTGLSRGVHYWEFTVDRCDPGGQPAFGIAKYDCNKEIMLGLDMKSWSIYFDYKRSWFLHNGEHFERTDGGIHAGSVVGIRFDCNRGSLSYYLNDQPHGPIAFTNLPSGIYYPAVSLTRAIQLTLHSGLEAPSESEESDEDSSGGGTGTETTSMATTVLTLPSTLQSKGLRQ
uniref:Tripartite motif protein trim9, putative n=2 Tax=Schistosoma mansoni TaxID=6183 RepID=A0A5K4F9Q8_SCHMA